MRYSGKKNIDPKSAEQGAIRKKWTGRLPIALVFPNSYKVGMSNLGFQLVYDLFNQHPDVVCERIFVEEDGLPLRSVESGRPLEDFAVLAFSVSFEQDYFNVVQVVRQLYDGSVSSENLDRPVDAGRPLVMAGGVATFMNPEPLAPFVDLFYLGEAEDHLGELVNLLVAGWADSTKQSLLHAIAATVPCCYAPFFYTPDYDEQGRLRAMEPAADLPRAIPKNTHRAKEKASHSVLLSPAAEFAEIYLTELGRGCSRGCRFCAAGFVYRPARLWSASAVINAFGERPAGKNRIGLLGMEMAHPKELGNIVDYLLANSCELSFSSLRADRINGTLLELLKRSRIKTVAIAPDGGSERLRRVINKGISEQDVLSAAQQLFEAEIKNLKLYFMIGLPGETMADLAELVKLVMKVREIMVAVGRTKGALGNITLSVNSFVPKPWTPFQYHPFEEVGSLKEKIGFLKQNFSRVPNLRLMHDIPDKVLLQAVLARGDRRVGEALGKVKKMKNWQRVFRQSGVDPQDYVYRQREENELFPWDIVAHKISKEYLWAEYQRALAEGGD